jgi:hypothetical protein
VNSVYEVLQWHDPRLAYDLDNEAKCVFGSGSTVSTSIEIFASEYDGDYQRIWKPTMFLLNQRGSTRSTKAFTNVDPNGYVTRVSHEMCVMCFKCCLTRRLYSTQTSFSYMKSNITHMYTRPMLSWAVDGLMSVPSLSLSFPSVSSSPPRYVSPPLFFHTHSLSRKHLISPAP